MDAFPLSVIPAEVGIQIWDDPVDCVFRGFSRCFPVPPSLDPRFFGDPDPNDLKDPSKQYGCRTVLISEGFLLLLIEKSGEARSVAIPSR
jgi:hypothetical protein